MRSRCFAGCARRARRAGVVLTLPVLLVVAGRPGPAQAGWGFPGVTPPAEAAAGTAPPQAGEVLAAETPAETVNGLQPSPEASASTPAAVPTVVADAPASVGERPVRSSRPRFLVAVSMGASIDSSWSASTKTFISPTFAATLEFGDGPMGFGLRLLSTQASGRGADSGPDRLALDLLLAVRPWASRRNADDAPWGRRFLRALTLDVGLVAEQISAGAASDVRGGPVFGAHADLPLTAAGGDGELRLRLAGRRMLAGKRTVGTAQAGDSTEAFGGLVVAF